MKLHRFGTLGVLAALALGAAPATAPAAPVTVNLRIEGAKSTIFEGNVTTNAKTIAGHRCNGTNGGASKTPGPTLTTSLDDASKAYGFRWKGTWDPSFQDFLIDSIGPDANTSSKFWGYAYNWQASQVGGCQQKVRNGGRVLFAYDYFSKSHLLELLGPTTVKIGRSVKLKVVDGQNGAPMSGASLGGATTGADGTATFSFGSPGLRRLKATRSDSVRSNGLDLCVYPARDIAAPRLAITGIRRGERFRRGHGPQLLAGRAKDNSCVTKLSFELVRNTARGCQSFNARQLAFTKPRGRCRARFQRLVPQPKWSYLLPRRLPRGRYVLVVKALDHARNSSTVRVRFTVR